VCVSGNMMMYYVEGNARYAVSPDVFVAFGVERKERRTYKIWEEGKPPDFVLEFSSKRTFRRDLDSKKTRYAALGVREYFLYDADKRYLPSPLMGFRLAGRDYIQIPARADGSVQSATLELALHIRPEGLRFYDPVAQRWLQTPAEAAEERAEAAEAEAARLREELERLKARR